MFLIMMSSRRLHIIIPFDFAIQQAIIMAAIAQVLKSLNDDNVLVDIMDLYGIREFADVPNIYLNIPKDVIKSLSASEQSVLYDLFMQNTHIPQVALCPPQPYAQHTPLRPMAPIHTPIRPATTVQYAASNTTTTPRGPPTTVLRPPPIVPANAAPYNTLLSTTHANNTSAHPASVETAATFSNTSIATDSTDGGKISDARSLTSKDEQMSSTTATQPAFTQVVIHGNLTSFLRPLLRTDMNRPAINVFT